MDFFITLRSSDSKNFYPLNNTNRFILQLDEQIYLNGQWKVGLVDFAMSKALNAAREIYIFSDICGNSIVGGTRTRLLRRFFLKRRQNDVVFSNPMYINVITHNFHSIQIDLKTREGLDIAFAPDTVITVVLHFKKDYLLQ